MASLSQVTGETRVILKWAGIILGVLLLIFLATRILGAIFPKPPPAPTVSFGKIPALEFPTSERKNLSFTIDTVTGSLPSFPTQIKVYRMQERVPDLLALVRAAERVENVGFANTPIKISESVYQWEDVGPPDRTLTMNILTSNFNLISSFLSDSGKLTFNATDQNSAINAAKTFLENTELLPEDLDEGKTKTSLFQIEDFSLIPATSLSSAQIIQINFYQKSVDNLPIYYSKKETSPINLLVAEISGSPQVVEANYIYQKASSEFATYPIKNAVEAFAELKKGNAYVVYHFGGNDVLVKNVSLGYFISDKEQTFLYPIVVFEGNNGFLAYLPAITDEWVSK